MDQDLGGQNPTMLNDLPQNDGLEDHQIHGNYQGENSQR